MFKKYKQIIILCSLLITFELYFALAMSHVVANSITEKESKVQSSVVSETAFGAGSNFGNALSKKEATTTEQAKDVHINWLDIAGVAANNISAGDYNIFPCGFYFLQPFLVFLLFDFLGIGYYLVQKDFFHTDNAGKEHGDAKLFNMNEIGSYNKTFTTKYTPNVDPYDPHILFSKNVKLWMNNKATGRNMNVIVFGGSGTGKSFRIIKPNMAQINSSAIITDPKGELFESMATMLLNKGIKVKLFSTSDMVHSNCYNPFDYVYNEDGTINEEKVSTMVFLYLKNASGAKEKSSGDPFWEKSAKAFISALVYYLLESDTVAKINRNFSTVLKLTQLGKVEEDSESRSQLDELMEAHRREMEAKHITSKAMQNYDTFKLAPGKTANSILITCAVDMQLFSNDNVRNLTRTDYDNPRNNVNLDKLGDEQTYLFINIPQANDTFNFLVAMMYSQLFDSLYTKAEKVYPYRYIIQDKFNNPVVTLLESEEEAQKCLEIIKKGIITPVYPINGSVYYQIRNKDKVYLEKTSKEILIDIIKRAKSDEYKIVRGGIKMPWHVRCLMDEFANIAEIPNFEKYLATIRSYEISCMIVLQSISQLKAKYKDTWEGIIGNCDTMIFLGSTENETCKYISEKLGDMTEKVRNTSYSKKSGVSYSYSMQKRSLMTPQEISKINENGKNRCLVMIRDVNPFLDDKLSLLEHPNFKLTGDADSKNKIEKSIIEMYFNSTPLKEAKNRNIVTNQKNNKKILGKTIYGKQATMVDDLKKKQISESNITETVMNKPTIINKQTQDKALNQTLPIIHEDVKKKKIEVQSNRGFIFATSDNDNKQFFI